MFVLNCDLSPCRALTCVPICVWHVVFLICYDVSNQTSFEHVKTKWYPEVHKHSPGVPIILVGTKSDMRENPEGDLSEFVEKNEANKVAKELGVADWLECSALYQQNVKEVFDSCLRHAGKSTHGAGGGSAGGGSGGCCILM